MALSSLETGEQLGRDPRGAAVREPDPDPLGERLGHERPIRLAMDLRPAHAADARELLRSGRDEDDVAVPHRTVIGHMVLTHDPAPTLPKGPRPTKAHRLDVVDRRLLDPVEIHRVVHVAEQVELVLAHRVA